jgi:large subunit ribosomal protein L4
MTTTLLRGGAASHGPRNIQNFSKAMPQKERRAALFSSLTVKANEKAIFSLEGFNSKAPKTKAFVSLLGKLPEAKKYLFVLPERDDVLRKSVSNIPNVKTILASYLNPLDALWAEKICFVADALQKAEDTFLTTDKK